MEDRTWAAGMTQDLFLHEYTRRFPHTDVIPGVEEYVNGGVQGVSYGIPDMPADPFEAEGTKQPEARIPQPGKFACRGCGKTFAHNIARAGHERKCKSVIKEGAHANP